jgi:hypothetical protein
MAIGFMLALFLIVIEDTPFLGGGLTFGKVFIHEIGHCISMWLFGYVALPEWDLEYGGGLAHAFSGQSYLIRIACFLLFIGLAWQNKKNKIIFVSLIIFACLFTIVGFFPFHHVVVSFMGHGFEMMIGSLLLFLAWFNVGFNFEGDRLEMEKSLSAGLGFYFNLAVIKNFYRVISDPFIKEEYSSPSARGYDNDFVTISYKLWVGLESVCYFAIGFAIFCIILPAILFLVSEFIDRRRTFQELVDKGFFDSK